jgi:hypothetical protein
MSLQPGACPGGSGRWAMLGGMGPNATVDMLTKIIDATPAGRDQEHIPVLVRCVPQIPDRTDALLGLGPSPLEALVAGALGRCGLPSDRLRAGLPDAGGAGNASLGLSSRDSSD